MLKEKGLEFMFPNPYNIFVMTFQIYIYLDDIIILYDDAADGIVGIISVG